MEGATPTFAAVVTARSNHSVQMSSMLSRMSWRSSVHYTLAGIKSLLKKGEGKVSWRERGGGGGFQNPWNPPLTTPLVILSTFSRTFMKLLDFSLEL